MNANRRKEIALIIKRFNALSEIATSIQEDIIAVCDEEEGYLANIPENLQESENYQNAEAAIEALASAAEELENLDLEAAIASLEEASA